MKGAVVFAILLSIFSVGQATQLWENIRPAQNATVQTKEVEGLLRRLFPKLKTLPFEIVIAPAVSGESNTETVTVQTLKRKVGSSTQDYLRVTAPSGVIATWGIHHYLKQYHNAHITWDVIQICKYLDSFRSRW